MQQGYCDVAVRYAAKWGSFQSLIHPHPCIARCLTCPSVNDLMEHLSKPSSSARINANSAQENCSQAFIACVRGHILPFYHSSSWGATAIADLPLISSTVLRSHPFLFTAIFHFLSFFFFLPFLFFCFHHPSFLNSSFSPFSATCRFHLHFIPCFFTSPSWHFKPSPFFCSQLRFSLLSLTLSMPLISSSK